jgi:predicted RNA-binding protein
MNNLISECDSICRGIITGIQREIFEFLDKLEADFIINFSKSLLGFLIMVPSNPDDPFQLIRGFINLFTSESTPKTLLFSRVKLSIFLSMAKFVTTQLQTRLPYHVFNVDSNDDIFTGDQNYIMEGNQIVETILTEILNEISEFDGKITPIDFDEFEFLINICGNCIEIFKYNFQKTSFAVSVTNKMFELIQKYIEGLSKNTAFGIKDKIQKYKKYFQKLQDS